MLLLEVDPRVTSSGDAAPEPISAATAASLCPVASDPGRANARPQAPLDPGVPGFDRLVGAVEQLAEGRVVRPVVSAAQDELLTKLGRVGAVPLGRRVVGHGLRGLILGRQRRRQPLSQDARAYEVPGDLGLHLGQVAPFVGVLGAPAVLW